MNRFSDFVNKVRGDKPAPASTRPTGQGASTEETTTAASPAAQTRTPVATPSAARTEASPSEELGAYGVETPSTEPGTGRSRLLPVLIGLATIALALGMMKTYASFVAPIFLALNLMIAAYPAYRAMTRFRVPRALASVLTGLIIMALLALFMYGMYWSVESMVQKLPEYSDQFNEFYQQIIDQAARLGLNEKKLGEQVKAIDPKSVASFAGGLLSNVGAVSSMMLVILTSLIFMMMDTAGMSERMRSARRTHGSFVDSLGAFAQGIRRYWIVTTVFGLIVAVLDWAVLVGLGVPLAMVWAIFSFLTNYIPNIGFVIGLVPPALLALVDKGPKEAIAVVVAYSVLNFVVQSIIQPKFAGNAVGLTPTLSFISLLLWTAVLGPLGALLALPMSLLVKALLVDPDPNTRWVNAFISSRPQDAISPKSVIAPSYTAHDD